MKGKIMKYLNISELAKTHGVDNMRFFFPAHPMNDFFGIKFTSSADEPTVVEAKAVERFNRVIADGYKMILQPIDETFAYRDFYIRDFESLAEKMPDKFYVTVNGVKV